MHAFLSFVQICKKSFQFLEENYGFKVIDHQREFHGVFLTYANATTAVRISYEPREGGIFVLLGRLIDGKIPEYPIFIRPDTRLNSFYLEDVISLKARDTQDKQKLRAPSTVADLEKTLQSVAGDLKHYATDILKGDFSRFAKFEKLVKARQKRLQKSSHGES